MSVAIRKLNSDPNYFSPLCGSFSVGICCSGGCGKQYIKHWTCWPTTCSICESFCSWMWRTKVCSWNCRRDSFLALSKNIWHMFAPASKPHRKLCKTVFLPAELQLSCDKGRGKLPLHQHWGMGWVWAQPVLFRAQLEHCPELLGGTGTHQIKINPG